MHIKAKTGEEKGEGEGQILRRKKGKKADEETGSIGKHYHHRQPRDNNVTGYCTRFLSHLHLVPYYSVIIFLTVSTSPFENSEEKHLQKRWLFFDLSFLLLFLIPIHFCGYLRKWPDNVVNLFFATVCVFFFFGF